MVNYRKYCRLCLRSNIVVNCDDIENLKNKIETLFGFEILPDDCPYKICRECIYQVTSFATFRELVLNNRKTIEDLKKIEQKIETIKKEDDKDDVIVITDEDSSKASSSNGGENRNSTLATISSPRVRLKKLNVILERINTERLKAKICEKNKVETQRRSHRIDHKDKQKEKLKVLNNDKNVTNKSSNNIVSNTHTEAAKQISKNDSKNKQQEKPQNADDSISQEVEAEKQSINDTENIQQERLQSSESNINIANESNDIRENSSENENSFSRNDQEKELTSLENNNVTNKPSDRNVQKGLPEARPKLRVKTVEGCNPRKTQNIPLNNAVEVDSHSTSLPSSGSEILTSTSYSNITTNSSPIISIPDSPPNCLNVIPPSSSSTSFNSSPRTASKPLVNSNLTLSASISSPITSVINSASNSDNLHSQPGVHTSQLRKPQTVFLTRTTTSSQTQGITKLTFTTRQPVTSSSTPAVETQSPPVKLRKITSLISLPTHLNSNSNNRNSQMLGKNRVSTKNLFFMKPGSQNMTNYEQNNIEPTSVDQQNTVNGNFFNYSIPSFINNAANDKRVKVLSVNELNSRAIFSSPQQQWTVVNNTTNSTTTTSPKLPIKITLTKSANQIHIKLTDQLSSDIHFNSLTLQERDAVRKSLLHPTSKSKIMRALKDCCLDKYSEDLLNSLGLRSIFSHNNSTINNLIARSVTTT